MLTPGLRYRGQGRLVLLDMRTPKTRGEQRLPEVTQHWASDGHCMEPLSELPSPSWESHL